MNKFGNNGISLKNYDYLLFQWFFILIQLLTIIYGWRTFGISHCSITEKDNYTCLSVTFCNEISEVFGNVNIIWFFYYSIECITNNEENLWKVFLGTPWRANNPTTFFIFVSLNILYTWCCFDTELNNELLHTVRYVTI